LRVSVATGMRNFLAAADKLPSSTEDTSIAMASSRSKLLTKKRGTGESSLIGAAELKIFAQHSSQRHQPVRRCNSQEQT
jgi:hypothetical protein